jgi:hypothetical protein
MYILCSQLELSIEIWQFENTFVFFEFSQKKNLKICDNLFPKLCTTDKHDNPVPWLLVDL